MCVCPKAWHPAPCYLFLLCSWSTRLFHPYSGLLFLILHHNSSRLLQPLVLHVLTSTLALFRWLLLIERISSSAARSILPDKFSACPYITLGHSTRQRGKHHSRRFHSSLLRYIPFMLCYRTPNLSPLQYYIHSEIG